MSIVDLDKIDSIGLDKLTNECVLTISDHLDWVADKEHYLLLQDKINSYLAFIESGEIIETYPNATGKRLRIDVVFKYKPIDTTTLITLKNKIEEIGINFTTQIIADNKNIK